MKLNLGIRTEKHTLTGHERGRRDDGVVPNPCSIREMYSKLCVKATVPHIRLHDLRHTHASLLLEQGVHPKIVSERLGHVTMVSL